MSRRKTTQIKKLSISFIGFIYLSIFSNAQAQQILKEKISSIETSYLDSKDSFKDYILDTGDSLYIEFVSNPDLSGNYLIDEQGEIYLPRIREAYVRGLTIIELTELLENRFNEFLISPEIYIRINTFKPIRVSIRGQVRSPGIIKFPAFIKASESTSLSIINTDSENINSPEIKRETEYITTLSNAIRGVGGLTSYSDISNIEIIRDIPIGKGGGKKRAIIDFNSYVKKLDTVSDIRLFDGDSIFIPTLQKADPSLIPNSILSGLSEKFINVTIAGKVENPGDIKIPIEGSLSDAMNLSGPVLPLSGKVILIRYTNNGSIIRKKISYSSNASPGSKRNPFLKADDLITVKSNIIGRAARTLKAVTDPFIGIYTTKETIQDITN